MQKITEMVNDLFDRFPMHWEEVGNDTTRILNTDSYKVMVSGSYSMFSFDDVWQVNVDPCNIDIYWDPSRLVSVAFSCSSENGFCLVTEKDILTKPEHPVSIGARYNARGVLSAVSGSVEEEDRKKQVFSTVVVPVRKTIAALQFRRDYGSGIVPDKERLLDLQIESLTDRLIQVRYNFRDNPIPENMYIQWKQAPLVEKMERVLGDVN